MINLTEKQIDDLLVEVDQFFGNDLSKSEKPAKEVKLEKVAPPIPDQGPEVSAEPQMAPPAAAQSDAPAMADKPAEMAPEAAAQPPVAPDQSANPEAQPAQVEEPAAEGQEGEADISDEELEEIYGSMNPEELERHYLIIRAKMQQAYASANMDPQADLKDEAQQAQMAPDQAAPVAPAPEAQPEQSAEVSPDIAQKPEEKIAMKSEEKSTEELAKAEKEISSLNGENTKLKAQLTKLADLLVKNIQRPERKAVTDLSSIEYVGKSEKASNIPEVTEEKLIDMCNQKAREDLKKSERDLINNYFLTKTGKEELINFLFGGNK